MIDKLTTRCRFFVRELNHLIDRNIVNIGNRLTPLCNKKIQFIVLLLKRYVHKISRQEVMLSYVP